jgi:addiction module RelE/StbE family toxin
MKSLIWTNKFTKAAKKFIESNPEKIDQFKKVISQLEEDAFDPSLKTHKLKGKMSGMYGCSISFSYRIVFLNSDESIILLNIGDHEEVY